jgi:hypothetical protein
MTKLLDQLLKDLTLDELEYILIQMDAVFKQNDLQILPIERNRAENPSEDS